MPRNFVELLRWRVSESPEARAVLRSVAGRWEEMSWQQLDIATEELAHGLVAEGIEPGDRVAILSRSRAEWLLADLAILKAAACSVPVHADAVVADIAHMLRDSGARLVFVQDENQAARLEPVLGDTAVEKMVLMVGPAQKQGQLRWEDLRSAGRAHQAEYPDALQPRQRQLEPDSPASIVYTAGTTGQAKGVVLNQENFLFEVEALGKVMAGVLDASDIHMLCLPLSHILARGLVLTSVQMGYTTAFSSGLESLERELGEVRPTFMTVVPGILERIHGNLEAQLQRRDFVTRQLVNWATGVGRRVARLRRVRAPLGAVLGVSHLAADALILSRTVKERFGGKLKFFVCGGAPLSPEIAEWFESLGVLVLEGYGTTENTGAANVNRPDRYRFGSVGPPVPGVEEKLDEDGEILIRGPNIMQGYWNRPDESAEVLDADGWLHTGDLGRFDEEGFLYVTGRKKDIIVTSGGKNVSPQNIEKLMRTSPYIHQLMVCGDGRKFLTALVAVDAEAVQRFAEREGIAFDRFQELVVHPRVRRLIASEIEERNHQLAGYQTIRRFTILPESFSLDAGEVTATMKLRRQAVEERYRDLIDAMYEQNEERADQVFLGES